VRLLQSWGYPIRQIEPSDLKRLAPGLQPGTVAAASFTEVDGHVDAAQVLDACLTRATHLGAQIETTNPVIGLDKAHQENETAIVQAVITKKGAVPCDSVVLAAGADTPRLAAHAELDVPLHHTFGATILTEPMLPMLPEVAVVHTHVDVDPQMAFRQLPDGSVMIHGGLHGGAEDRSLGQTEGEIQQVMAKAVDLWPALEGVAVREVRRGRRPIPADGQSILGFTDAVPNLYLAATHSGVTLAPLIGELAAIEMLDGVSVDLLTPYRLERFG
jgi:glycine/D-amino acid oxidase-like deaminating enzyme